MGFFLLISNSLSFISYSHVPSGDFGIKLIAVLHVALKLIRHLLVQCLLLARAAGVLHVAAETASIESVIPPHIFENLFEIVDIVSV